MKAKRNKAEMRNWIVLDADEPCGIDPWCDFVDAKTYREAEAQARVKHPNRNIMVGEHDQSVVPPAYETTLPRR